MSSKVRLLLWNSRVGKWAVGRNVNHHMQEEAQRTGAMLPLAFAKEPRWKKVLWLFDHVKTEGSKLYIWREPRRTTKKRSPYVQMAGLQLGRIGKLFTAAETIAWDANRRARERKVLAEVRRREAGRVVGRTATGRLNLDALPQAPRFRVVDAGGEVLRYNFNNAVVQNRPAAVWGGGQQNIAWNQVGVAEQVPQANENPQRLQPVDLLAEELRQRANRQLLREIEGEEDVG